MQTRLYACFCGLLTAVALAAPATAQSAPTQAPAFAFTAYSAVAPAAPSVAPAVSAAPAASPDSTAASVADPTAAPVADPTAAPVADPVLIPAAAPAPLAVSVSAPPAEVQLAGRVETTQGGLPGATVRLLSLGQVCVTNEAGAFFFTVPAGSGPLAAAVSYPGCAEMGVTLVAGGTPEAVQLAPPEPSRADRRQLRPYLRTAHREIERDLRHLR